MTQAPSFSSMRARTTSCRLFRFRLTSSLDMIRMLKPKRLNSPNLMTSSERWSDWSLWWRDEFWLPTQSLVKRPTQSLVAQPAPSLVTNSQHFLVLRPANSLNAQHTYFLDAKPGRCLYISWIRSLHREFSTFLGWEACKFLERSTCLILGCVAYWSFMYILSKLKSISEYSDASYSLATDV